MRSLLQPSLAYEALRQACRVFAPGSEVSRAVRTTRFQLGLCRRCHGSAPFIIYRIKDTVRAWIWQVRLPIDAEDAV